jgi:hypothetical protein
MNFELTKHAQKALEERAFRPSGWSELCPRRNESFPTRRTPGWTDIFAPFPNLADVSCESREYIS